SFKAWDKDSIRIDALVTVKAEDNESSEEIMDDIDLETSENDETIRFRTGFSDDFYSPHSFNVRYEIYLPAGHEIKVTNRFGNIDIASVTGRMEIDLEHGDLKQTGMDVIDDLQGQFAFSNVQIGSFRNAGIELNNADLTVESTENAEINGKYCQIDVASAGKLTIKTHTGRVNTGKVEELEIDGQFCFSSIEEIEKEGHIEINNGLLMIESVSKGLQKLSVKNDNAPVNLSIPASLSYTLHGEVTNGQFRHYHQKDFKIIKDMERTSFSGGHNTEEQKGASIVLFNKNAGINIKE
ncbi:MAG: hypothetical protein ACOCPW_05375, partial [Marinilabiliaceae bacterium]